MDKTVILAYSGGLDTSCILAWLIEQGYKVVAYTGNVGQEEDFDELKKKALNIGATEVVIDDLRSEFVEDFIYPALEGSLVYESRYLLGTSLARPCLAKGMMKAVAARGARFVSHGATGKGNDQVRFELACYAIDPSVQVIAPWRMREFVERFRGRKDLMAYAEKRGIPVPVTPSAPWSMDANLMHISYESGILEDPSCSPPSDLYQMTVAPEKAIDQPQFVRVHFVKGLPVSIEDTRSGKKVSDSPYHIFLFANEIGSRHGVGRIDIVENRFIGIKSRGVYETPGATILHAAHLDLETFVLDREVLRLKMHLSGRMADFVYNGFWFSPEMEFTRRCISISQERVTGSVDLKVYKGNVYVLGRASSLSSYNQALASMDEHGPNRPENAEGFIHIHSLRLKEWSAKKSQ